jgi:Zn-dependent alcohol dehydrogenase
LAKWWRSLLVLGHESAGIVVALGAGVEGLAVGDHVVTAFVPSCGHCGPCVAHRPALCEPGFAVNSAGTLLSGERRWSDGNTALHHHLGISGFADHAVMAAESLVRETAPDVLIAEPVGSCTDLVATVTLPLEQIYGDRFTVAPMSVVAGTRSASVSKAGRIAVP